MRKNINLYQKYALKIDKFKKKPRHAIRLCREKIGHAIHLK
jgi:hypothetical protein